MSIYQRTGARRHRIEVQAVRETRSSKGGVTKTWSTEKKVWGEILPVRGLERFAGRVLNAEISHLVRIPYTEDLTPKKRLKHNGRVLEIEGINNEEERNVKMELNCIEKV